MRTFELEFQLKMSAAKKTTVLQTESVHPLESASPLIQTAAHIAQGEIPTTSQLTSAMESGWSLLKFALRRSKTIHPRI